ncbi:MAG: ribonuclease H-like domain-containing protein [Treponema sp.]|nr:ribonuclease H-like domain-containing protein [Treponema sp.]
MGGNLRDRLRRIQLVRQEAAEAPSKPKAAAPANAAGETGDCNSLKEHGWASAGYMILRREVVHNRCVELPRTMPEDAGVVISGIGGMAAYEDLLFFDLETTGLSGGAGTVAFLAAFGRLAVAGGGKSKNAPYNLHITQYLLLDYPGENDFIAALANEFLRDAGCIMVSYNGKSFDSQILATRCLMNGIAPPEYRHADLLYPARRLWKRLLPGCSQGTVESHILGIDRTGDIPGAMAPDIWFSFLRNGDAGPLLGICEHNRRDICGLAAIFAAMIRIAGNPVAAAKNISFDLEALSLRFGTKLMKEGKFGEGRGWLHTAAGENGPPSVRAAALRVLAIDSERLIKDPAQALDFAERGIELLPLNSSARNEFERRIQRLKCRLK